MFRVPPTARLPLRLLAISVSAGLFAYLVWRAGPNNLWHNLLKLGWGFTAVIGLAGISHLAKTWAWQLTLGDDKDKISFPRLVGLRLGAEAAGQLGILGQTFGDSVRVSQLNSKISIANSLASVTLDRGLYVVTATALTIAGILAALPVLSISHTLRLYASLFAFAMTTFLLFTLVALQKRWPLFSGSARLVGRIPYFRNWMEQQDQLIRSVENALFDFHHNTPKAFWMSFSLNLACQCLAVAEVCLVLWLIGANLSFFGALVIEALTKLVNVVGNCNPGNIGTYEGGNMLIGKMLGLSSAGGLALALARRLRALFWAAVGGICLVLLTRPQMRRNSGTRATAGTVKKSPSAEANPPSTLSTASEIVVAIFLTGRQTNANPFRPPLARVGSLPILLRTILGAQKAGAVRIIVVTDRLTRLSVERELSSTKRLPRSVQWIESAPGTPLSRSLPLIVNHAHGQRLVLLDGNNIYHPSLLRKAAEWNDERAAMTLLSGEASVGIYAVRAEAMQQFTEHCATPGQTLAELHASFLLMHRVICLDVPDNLWQRVRSEEDRASAERKLDRWLVKPTDGMYAQMNRRISIPISRQLIKFRITANMVSLFTLGVGFASAVFFAFGGYWYTLLGAFLCLFASILDGCDGEVARLKLLESDFGCWLETICDYLFYLLLFVGMTVGQWRSSGSKLYLVWGGLLLFGALASFLATAWERHRLAAGRPEQFLGIWQTHAESRPSNPFLYLGRRMEFIIRRCFFPYALLFFALLGIMNVAFVLSVIGANLVWPIALYSSCTFAGARGSTVASPAASA
jgi:phosphatidylglycerophosphate synthase